MKSLYFILLTPILFVHCLGSGSQKQTTPPRDSTGTADRLSIACTDSTVTTQNTLLEQPEIDEDTLFSWLNVEGSDLFLMLSFESDSTGNFTLHLSSRDLYYQLVDKDLGVYRRTWNGKHPEYVIQATHIHRFDMIRYTGNPRGIFSSFTAFDSVRNSF